MTRGTETFEEARIFSAPNRGSRIFVTLAILFLVSVLLISPTYLTVMGTAGTETVTRSIPQPSASGCIGPAPCGSSPNVLTAGAAAHDLTVSSTNVTDLAGAATPFHAALPSGLSATAYTWWWGDGNFQTSATGDVAYTYSTPGIFLFYVQATDSAGNVHDNLQSLLRHPELDSATRDGLGNLPQLGGNIVANDSANVNATAAISPGGFVSVSNWILEQPSNPGWSLSTPTYTVSSNAVPSVTISNPVTNSTGISGATVIFAANTPFGSYPLTFVVPSQGKVNGVPQTALAYFTFTIFIGPGAEVPPLSLPVSPHRGSLLVYSNGSLVTLDPAIEYDYGATLVQELYQTLVAPSVSQSGSDIQDFVPDLATCVPGSALCVQLYGSSLVSGHGNYTFVINPGARFYDPSTGAHWPVYPNDVAFSLVRACLYFSPGLGRFTGGWVQCQAILPSSNAASHPSNASWDSGLHTPYNSTPANLLSAIRVNDSAFCYGQMNDTIHGAGCVTLETGDSLAWSGGGIGWPAMMGFMSVPWGAPVISCSWAASKGMGLPGWSNGNQCIGAPPGSPGNPNGIPSDTSWDGYELTGLNGWATSPLRWSAVGSGPYFLAAINDTTNYTLEANPHWGGTTCQGGRLAGCLPLATPTGGTPSYIARVKVELENTTTPGKMALLSQAADLADIRLGDISFLVSGVESGRFTSTATPTISVNLNPLVMNYSVAVGQAILGATPTLPSTLLQDLNLREFLATSYPAETIQNQACDVQGVQFCFQYGGAIPAYMTGYYPRNISWQLSDPSTDATHVGGAAWWWAQAQGDGIVGASCTASSPCTFPLAISSNVTALPYSIANATDQLWIREIRTLSGGALNPVLKDVSRQTWFSNVFAPPGGNGMPIYTGGWLPDFFDPADYVDPFYSPDIVYATGVYESLTLPKYLAPCAGGFATPQVTQGCQGTAYLSMNALINSADACALPYCTNRALLYNDVERIAYNLSLEVPAGQATLLLTSAPWIDPSSLVRNPLVGSLGTVAGQPFYDLSYISVVPGYYPLSVSQIGGGASGTLALAQVTAPTLAGISLSAPTLTVETGETIVLLVGVAGGTGVYHYAWNGLPGGCSSADKGVLTCQPNISGTYTLGVVVTDSAGDAGASPPLNLAVLQGTTISAFRVTPGTVPLGSAAAFDVTTSGGIGSLRYFYTGLPPGCASQDVASLMCTPATPGSYSVAVTVTDSVGVAALSTTSLNVIGPGALASVQLNPSTATVPAGGSVQLAAAAIGANGSRLSPGVSYNWTVWPITDGIFDDSKTATVTFTADAGASGAAVITVVATYFGGHQQAQVLLTITPASNILSVLTNPIVSGVIGAAGGAAVAAIVVLRIRRPPPPVARSQPPDRLNGPQPPPKV